MSKKLHYTYLYPQHYFSHLMSFFILVSFFLTLTLSKFNLFPLDLFLLRFIVILFLILTIGVLIEFFKKSEYISPLTLYDITGFTQSFLKAAYKKKNYDIFFLKYSSNAKKIFEKNFSKKQHYFISTIKKQSNTYEVTLINEIKLFQYFFFKFFGKFAIHKIYVQKIDGEYKIVCIK